MIWLAWRQFRTQAVVAFGAVAVFATVLVATAPRPPHRRGGDLGFLNDLGGADTAFYLLGWLAVLAAPVLIGMFWGAPLITRELDAGTHRLVWTQTTRTRWLVTKLGLVGLAAMAAAGSLCLAVTWWAGPIDAAIAGLNGRPGPGVFVVSRLSPVVFGARGVVPLGYAAFAFTLGVTLGIIVRRTLPAMAVLLAVFFVAQLTMAGAIRQELMSPERRTTPITSGNLMFIGDNGLIRLSIDRPGAWVIGQRTIDAAGRSVPAPSWVGDCVARSSRQAQECSTRLAALGYRQEMTYHPGSRFWSLQFRETAIYLVVSAALAALCTWWLRYRLP